MELLLSQIENKGLTNPRNVRALALMSIAMSRTISAGAPIALTRNFASGQRHSNDVRHPAPLFPCAPKIRPVPVRFILQSFGCSRPAKVPIGDPLCMQLVLKGQRLKGPLDVVMVFTLPKP
jgi:hypothetical protein